MQSSRSLSENLSKVREVAEATGSQNSVLHEYQSKIDQNLKMKEKCIDLETKLKLAEEQISLLNAEYSFQRSELQAEIDSLKSIEKDLRQAIIKLTNDKNKQTRNYELKLKSAISAHEQSQKEAFDSFQEEIQKLKEENSNLQVNNEVLQAENRKLSLHNEGLNEHFQSQGDLSQKQIDAVKNHLEGDSEMIANLRNQIIQITSKYEDQNTKLQNDLITEQRKASYLDGQMKIQEERQKQLEKQIAELKRQNEELSEKIIQKGNENGSLQSLVDQMKTEKAVLEMKAHKERQIAIQMQNRLSECDNVSSCSPLMRTRVSLLQTFCKEWNLLKHELYGHTDFTLRDLILSIIFTKRWISLHSASQEQPSGIVAPNGALNCFAMTSPKVNLHNEIVKLVRRNIELERYVRDFDNTKRELEVKLSTSKDKNHQKKQEKEAMALKLKTALRCNNMLHKHMKTVIPDY